MKHASLTETDIKVLEEIAVRFFINTPPELLSCLEDLKVLMTESFWYIQDIYKNILTPKTSSLYSHGKMSQERFIKGLVSLIPPLQNVDVHSIISNSYSKAPVCGCIIIDQTLTQIFIQKSIAQDAYGFPKGKQRQNESSIDTALRETLEETGWDVSPYIYPDITFKTTKNFTFYLVAGFPIQEAHPLVRNESCGMKWIPLSDLQSTRFIRTISSSLILQILSEVSKLKKH